MQDVHAVVLAPDVMAPRSARQFATKVCAGAVSAGLAADLAIVVSELVTNAVTHGTGETRVQLSVGPGQVHLAVSDRGHGFVPGSIVQAGLGPERRRGLSLVEALSSRWGVHPDEGGGTTAWCVVGFPVRSVRPVPDVTPLPTGPELGLLRPSA